MRWCGSLRRGGGLFFSPGPDFSNLAPKFLESPPPSTPPFAVAAIILSAWPGLLNLVSKFLGIAQPINLLFVGGFFVVLLLLMQISLELARTRDELRKAVQKLALEMERRSKDDG